MNDEVSTSWFERRRHRRFRVRPEAFVVLKPDNKKMGPIVDIGIGGLSFYYIDQEFTSQGKFNLCIIIGDTLILLDNVSVRTISDSEIPSDDGSGPIVKRRCGVEFEGLTKDQIAELDFFIKNHTITSTPE